MISIPFSPKIEIKDSIYNGVKFKALFLNGIEIKQRDRVQTKCLDCECDVITNKKSIMSNNGCYCKKCSFLKKYGVTNCFQLNSVKEKIKQTNLSRYGIDYILKDKEKMKKSIMAKYNVEHNSQREDIKLKLKNKIFTEEYKNKISVGLKKAHQDVNKYKEFINKGGKSKWIEFVDKTGKIHKCQGTYELRLAKILDNLNYKWELYHKQIILSSGERYAPDFIIENKYIDTKANYFYELSKDKIDLAKNEIGLVLILTNDLINIEKNPKLLENYLWQI